MAPPEIASHPGTSCPSNVLADLRLHHRKAFELCATVLSALRRYGADPGAPAMAKALEEARELAEAELKTQKELEPFETFLAGALTEVIRVAEKRAESFPLNEAGQKGLISIRVVQASPPDLSTAEENCLIKGTYEACVRAAATFYSDHLAHPFEFPKISLRIGPADGLNEAFPGRKVAFNGSVQYKDAPPQKHSIVTLKVAPACLNRGCLPALPYILMHEILCHWPQMARRAGARPNPEPVDDPWNRDAEKSLVDPISEGWMDSLVPQVLARRCADPDVICWEEVKTAEEMHGERTQINRAPAFADVAFTRPGALAAYLVERLYSTDPNPDPSTAYRDFRRLSCELNAADWTYHARRVGCNNIILACMHHSRGAELSARDAIILGGLWMFRRHGDLVPLVQALNSG